MTTIALVRHGQTDWNKVRRIQGITDIPLNDEGRAQARAAAATLADSSEHWDGLVSSPLSRARETGLIIAQTLALPQPVLEPGFQERYYGEAEGLTISERASKFPDGNVPGVEDPELVLERAVNALQQIALDRPDSHVIVTTHGGVISTLLRALTRNAVPSAGMMIRNGSVNTIAVNSNGDISIEQLDIDGDLAEYDFVSQ